MGHAGAGGRQGGDVHAPVVQGHGPAHGAALAVHLADLGIARVLHGEHRLRTQQLCQQKIQIFRAGAHHDLLRGHGHALVVPQIVGNGLPQSVQALVGHGAQQGFAALTEDLAGEPGPGGDREAGHIHLVAFQVQPPDTLFRLGRQRLRRRGRRQPLHRGNEKAPLGLSVHISLCLQLLVSPFHGDDGQLQVLRQPPLGGQPLPGGQGAAEDVAPDAAVQVFV